MNSQNKGNMLPLLVGVRTCTAAMEISVAVPQEDDLFQIELIYLKTQLNHSWAHTQRIFHPTTEAFTETCSSLSYS